MGNCWPKPVDNVPSSSIKAQGCNRGPAPAGVPASGMIVTPILKKFALAELRNATRNFRPDTVLGEGGFGRVFKGYIHEKTYGSSRPGVGLPVAIKKSSLHSQQGLKEWQAEVKFLGKLRHPNLVRLLGYCWEERQFLLVYEYMEGGSLDTHLFKREGEAMGWELRMKIAVGAARGLAFLHTTEEQVIFRDFKTSNILLDVDFNAKLSDFGLAKLGPTDGNSHVSTKPMGSYGYAAPEYIATGHLYVKSDVYGFGVVLLEIVMGLRVLDPNRPGGRTNLVEWAMPSLHNKRKFKKLVDPRLKGQYPSQATHELANLIHSCLENDPKNRPNMEQVLDTLERISSIQFNHRRLSHDGNSSAHQQHINAYLGPSY